MRFLFNFDGVAWCSGCTSSPWLYVAVHDTTVGVICDEMWHGGVFRCRSDDGRDIDSSLSLIFIAPVPTFVAQGFQPCHSALLLLPFLVFFLARDEQNSNASGGKRMLPDPGQGRLIQQISSKLEEESKARLMV